MLTDMLTYRGINVQVSRPPFTLADLTALPDLGNQRPDPERLRLYMEYLRYQLARGVERVGNGRNGRSGGDITPVGWDALQVLDTVPDMGTYALAHTTGHGRNGITAQCTRMVAAGWVERTEQGGQHGRWRITPAGRAALAERAAAD